MPAESAIRAGQGVGRAQQKRPPRGKIGLSPCPLTRRPGAAAKRLRANDQILLGSSDRMSILPPSNRVEGIGAYFADVLLRTERDGNCILWAGGQSTKGYGQLKRGDLHLGVHRIAYVWAYGDIPDDLVVDHLCHDPATCSGRCKHRLCVNPRHLAARSNEENLRRQGPAHKSHCVNGHEFDLENTGRTREGRRYCRTCNNERSRNRSRARQQFTAEVRAWLVSRGLAEHGRGRLPQAAIAAWNAAHPDRLFAEREGA